MFCTKLKLIMLTVSLLLINSFVLNVNAQITEIKINTNMKHNNIKVMPSEYKERKESFFYNENLDELSESEVLEPQVESKLLQQSKFIKRIRKVLMINKKIARSIDRITQSKGNFGKQNKKKGYKTQEPKCVTSDGLKNIVQGKTRVKSSIYSINKRLLLVDSPSIRKRKRAIKNKQTLF